MSGRTASSGRGREDGEDPSLDAATNEVLVASRALVGVAARSLAEAESEITLRQYRALVLLAARGEQNVGTLADSLGIHPSTATRLCDRLHGKGLIDRSTSSESRREVTVRVSATGQNVVRTVTSRRREEIQRILGRLDTSTRRHLVDAFRAFTDAAGEVPDDAWQLGWTA